MGEVISVVAFVLLHWVHPVIVLVELTRLIRGWAIPFRSKRQPLPVALPAEVIEPKPDEQHEGTKDMSPAPHAVIPQPVPWGDAQPKKVTVYVYEF
ncbi:hypothetical protein [Streptomyces pseudovenezuelae]|uniref:hypothetical protein n=1 Tax=Streptomyces pseudovenezuelae TaxID=67350 RepID=UPI0036DFD888